MGFKCGIVGLPNVGKSTLYNALTRAGIAAENYPFCTIDPNIGVVPVPDPRLQALADIASSAKVIPTTMEFVDIAGLVAGASKGEGLGNTFLANIRETHAIAHVVRCFENDDVMHVAGRVSPADDIETINTELMLSDMDAAARAEDRAAKMAKAADKSLRAKHALLVRAREHLESENRLHTLELEPEEALELKSHAFLTAKPVLYIANVAEDGFENNPMLDAVREVAARDGSLVVPVCAAIEAELSGLEPDEQAEFLTELGLEEPGLNRVIRAGYELLSLQTFFTAGPKEARAWTVRTGSTAPEAAGVIHTDFEKGFIRAEVIAYDDYIEYQGEARAKEAGRWRLEGREYRVAEGDVMHFRFNV